MASGAIFVMAFTSAAQAKDKIDVGDMPHYCQQKAAQAFGVHSDDVSTLPAEHDEGKYFVYGQTPAQGRNALFFVCKFDEDRKFDKVVKKSDSGSQAQSEEHSQAHGGGIAVKDMARFCAGEASAKFHQRPSNISAQPANEDHGMYSVFGQFPPSGADPTVCICTFSSEGKLVGVDKQ